jgi:hypothetical protein
VCEHERILVHVDDSRAGIHFLCHLMGVARGGQAGADVEELGDAQFGDRIAHAAAEEHPVGPRHTADAGYVYGDRVAQVAVGGVVVHASEPVVDARLVRDSGVDRGR